MDITNLNEEVITIKEPPQSIDMEHQVLGSILINDKLLDEVIDILSPKVFYLEKHQEIYNAMLYFKHSNIEIGLQNIIDRMKHKGYEDKIVDYIIKLSTSVVSESSFVRNVDYIIDIYRKRELYKLYKEGIQKDLNGIASSELVKSIESKIENMGISNNLEVDNFSDYIDEWTKQLEEKRVDSKFKTGFTLLDDTVLIEPSNLILIAARPSVGKSALALDLTKRFCKRGNKALFVSLEMSNKEIMNRLVANEAHVKAKKIKRKEDLTPNDWSKIMNANKKIKDYNLNIYAKGNMYIEQLIGLTKYLKKKGELDILIVDYLQLLDSHNHSKNRVQQVGYISRKLKQIAMDLNIPVIALSQLSRSGVEQGGKIREPQLSDLRDSGSLEQDANIVMMLHTDDINQKYQDQRFIKLFIRKNRDGKLDMINYAYYGDYVEFKEKQYNINTKQFEDVFEIDYDEETGVIEDLPF